MASPIPAATVILMRPAPSSGLEVFLLRRNRKASFMSNAFVFPGGKIDPDDGDAHVAAARELFEEAGVLLTDRPLDAAQQADWRRRMLASETSFARLLADEGLRPDRARLHAWSRWVTPSFEPKRFDAMFFVAELPPGQVPSFDDQETVEELWITPADALARQSAGTLRLPPPQIRTFHELLACGSIAAVFAEAAARDGDLPPLCPRRLPDGGITLLLPWDPDYPRGDGEGEAVPAGHRLATAPSRLGWDGASSTWKAM